jgi:hypothetical protein
MSTYNNKDTHTKGDVLMYTKRILSATAAVAVMTTGAVAFEAATSTSVQGFALGTIVSEKNATQLVKSSYNAAVKADNPIQLSGDRKGDALIYPAFSQKEGFGTEIVVRNTSNNAIVAKAVLYAKDDSQELLDFNIYLSGRDACRFTIKDGKITSTDGSIKTFGVYPAQAADDTGFPNTNDYTQLHFADEEGYALDLDFEAQDGYVVIFGMEQSDGITGDTSTYAFHGKHDDLYAAYAASLDKTRDGWRKLLDNSGTKLLINSMFHSGVATLSAPNINEAGLVTWEGKTFKKDDLNATFTDVSDSALMGEVRIFAEGRDMVIPATAIQNFTEPGKAILWTEGEYASIADRRIDIVSGNAAYVPADVKTDAEVFRVDRLTYTFANKDLGEINLDNKVLITQPYKRLLAQLNEATNVGYLGNKNYTKYKVDTGMGYYFSTKATRLVDEDEKSVTAALGGTIITSGPGVHNSIPVTYNHELEIVGAEAFENSSEKFGAYFKDKNGFADFSIGIPAVITQMVGSKAGASAEMNWIYNDTTKSTR